MGIPTGFLWVCLWVWVSVAKVRFGPVFILSGETGNQTASSVQHIAQTGTGTARNGSDRFGLHLNQVQTWNCWPSGFWPCESSTHIYWCCVDQIRAVTPRFACRFNRFDLQGFSCSGFTCRSNGLNLQGFSFSGFACRSNGLDLQGFSCSGFARRPNRLDLQGFWNSNSRPETAHSSSSLKHSSAIPQWPEPQTGPVVQFCGVAEPEPNFQSGSEFELGLLWFWTRLQQH